MKTTTTQDYLNKLIELGIDKPDSQLRTRFREGGNVRNGYEHALVDEGESMKIEPPPLTEDYSHLNPKDTNRRASQARKAWHDMSEVERARRIKILSLSGKEGGKARKFSIRLTHPTLYKKTN